VCGRDWGSGAVCQFCSQVDGLPSGIHLSSPARRFGAYLLDLIVATFTLYIGWLIWAIIVWSRGQSPGKQILGMRCVKLGTGTKATWGTMFVRDFVCKGLLFGILAVFTFGIGLILYFWLTWDSKNQELWDKMVGTIVVDDPNKLLA
jgi:uncharacterized RDD family membrane protein YckC